jgi:hypothetical protein
MNPLAPPAYGGVNDGSPPGFIDVEFSYVYDVVLAASELLTGQAVSLHRDADFAWRGYINVVATGTYRIQFKDSQGYNLSNDMLESANIAGTPSNPFPVFPEVLYPAGGAIGIDIEDTSVAQNTIQIVFRGVKRYRLAPVRG